ncbi:alpha/beta hydrolase fold domain-containing protein [Cupriavidus sp. WKF15]|uniref:alpha/beta hydrolase fold domain-containing protein n=1 Tax=Cupriavidus sp. WKF15 TaxID=3032282 RepID=UPI0023E28498|nr:alpha/beta hydrolase fold domain-containing protein [Cupriavidus sp. WKF15]WER50595.1 alpha/beta hydrolase fold domain-containing protein [Cupriavidus sp. WKF15]
MRVVIVGAGIGGLCAAISLRQRGIDVTVLEQAERLSEVGAGIQIASNGALLLRELGVEEDLAAIATQPDAFDYRDLATGKRLYLAPLGPEAAERYGAPMYNVHRADLIDILARALPSDVVRVGAKVAGVGQNSQRAWVDLVNGERVEADAVVGADGIHSAVRAALRGPEKTQFANILMWRALIPAHKLKGLSLPVRGNNWFGPGRTIISYWVRPDLYSILASVPAAEVHRESWSASGDVEELRRSFEGAEPTVTALLDQVETSFITGMYYRDPIEQWTTGRITLLGDAAHAMVPFLAQGACQSIEDAWTLATTLARVGEASIPERLLEYERRRQPRTTRVQSGARAIVKMVHESDPGRVRVRNGRWKGMARIDPLAETSWAFVWGHDERLAAQRAPGEVVGLANAREGRRMQRAESQRAFDIWKSTFSPEDVARGHDGMREAYERMLLTHFPAPRHASVEDVELNGVQALRVRAAEASRSNPVVLHFHGGAYVLGSAHSSLEYAHRIAEAVDGDCYTVEYRLAPEHPYPAAIDDALDAYRGLLASGVSPEQIMLSGESCGGGLALALAIAIRDAGLPAPAGVFAVCPFTDLTLSGPTVQAHSGDDPAAHRDSLSLLGASYFQGHEPTDPRVSPLFGNLRGLPPLFLAAVEGEVLLSDTTRLADKAVASGVDTTLRVIEDSVHVFTLFPFLPEARQIFAEFAAWSHERINVSTHALPTA